MSSPPSRAPSGTEATVPDPARAQPSPVDASTPAATRERLLSSRFLLLVATQATYGCVYSAFLLLPKYLARELHAGPDTIGAVMGVSVLGGILIVPWAARLLDGRRRAPLMVLGALLGAASALGFVAVNDVGPLLFALSLLLGVAFVLVFDAGGTLAAELAPPARLAQGLGLWGLATLTTNAIVPAVLEPVADHHGWHVVFALASTGGVVAALLATRLARGEPTPTTAPTARPIRARFRGERGRVLAAAGLTGLGLGTLFTFVVPYALELGAHRVSDFFLGYTSAALVVRLGFGTLGDRYGRARVSFAALLVYGVAVAAAAALTPATLPLVGMGLGVAHGIAYPTLNALAVAGVSRAERGSTTAYYFGVYSVGRSVSVAALGLLASQAGYPAAFLVGGALLAAGAFVMLPLVRAEGRPPPSATTPPVTPPSLPGACPSGP